MKEGGVNCPPLSEKRDAGSRFPGM